MVSKIKELLKDYKLLLNNVPALVTVAFVLGTVIMNISAGKIIMRFGGVNFTGGFALSWLPFLCTDTVTKHFGARAAILLNILSAVGNAFTVIFLAIVAAIPTPGQDYSAFNSVNGAVWYIALSSTVAFIVSGVANALLNSAIGKLFKKNPNSAVAFFARSWLSTFVGQALDNFLFLAGVFCIFSPMFGGMSLPVSACLITGVVGGLVELALEAILSPCGYIVAESWRKEGVGQAYIDAHKDDKF